MKSTQINWGNGKVMFWGIDDLDMNKSITSQVELLKEDLAQVEFGSDVVLDLGWYPEFDPNGQFVLSVVKLKDVKNPKGEDWENPALKLNFQAAAQFMPMLNKAIEAANHLASS